MYASRKRLRKQVAVALTIFSALLLLTTAPALAQDSPNKITNNYPPLNGDKQVSLSVGEKVYKQSCMGCHGPSAQGGYTISGKKVPPLSASNGYVDEVMNDFNINDEAKAKDVAYSSIRMHIRNPPGTMAVAIGDEGWSESEITKNQADALARWLINEAPPAPAPSNYLETPGENLSEQQLRDTYPKVDKNETVPREEAVVLYERSCAGCHESSVYFVAPPDAPFPGAKAPALVPEERTNKNMDTLTYYEIRNQIRNPSGLMHYLTTDASMGNAGYGEDVFTVKQADALARYIESYQGEYTGDGVEGVEPVTEPTQTAQPSEPSSSDEGLPWLLILGGGFVGVIVVVAIYNRVK